MSAIELYDQGDLRGAIEAANAEVRSAPEDVGRRIVLFELLCFAGDLDRAQRQLDAIAHQDAKTEYTAQTYVNALHAERRRRAVFAGESQPEFLRDAPPWAHFHLEAIAHQRAGRGAEASAALAESAGQRRPLRGTLDGQAFEDLCDCDDVLAPFLELIVMRDYVWLQLEQIRQIEIPKPEYRRDLVWAPVKLVLQDGEEYRAYVPVLYHGSHEHADDAVRLGRYTDWDDANGPVRGFGHRMMLVGEEAHPLLEIRTAAVTP